jgi:hypothetical protein
MTDLYSKASLILTSNAFSASKAYAVKPSSGTGDFSFSRATASGSRITSSGSIQFVNSNVPRLTYLTTSSSPSFLLEPQRTNHVIQSNGFSTTWTLQQATVTASQAVSPDGTNNAWKLNENTTNSTHDVRQNPLSGFTSVAGARYIISAYVKPAERNQVAIQSNIGGGFDYTKFNLIGTGSIQTTPAGHTASISLLTNGWYRISDAVTANIADTKFLSISLLSGSNETYTGTSNTTGLYIYGAQIESASYTTSTTASSYIPTTTTSATRNTDILFNSGMQSLSFVNSNIWTVFIDYNTQYMGTSTSGSAFLYLQNAAGTNLWYLAKTSTGIRGYDQINSAPIFNSFTSANASKIALTSDGTTIRAYVNGSDTGTTYTPSNSSTLLIDKIYADPSDAILGNPALSALIKNVIVYPTALSAIECNYLTTLNT